MSAVGHSYWTWERFAALEPPPVGFHYELHDGEVVLVPPAKPAHFTVQWRIVALLSQAFARDGEVRAEVPYRPAIDDQFWIADVAFLPRALLERLDRAEEWFPYAPALIVEVLSPSNRRAKIERQRDIAFDAGIEQFWIVDLESRTVEVRTRSMSDRTFGERSYIPLGGDRPQVAVDHIFTGR